MLEVKGDDVVAPPPDSPITLLPITVGAYKLFDISNDLIGITNIDGETGAFSKAEFEAHVAAFFGLNF